MTRQIPRTFIIPVETLNRELDGKLLLALHAAKRGLKPIIGGRTAINEALPSLPQSIFLSKGVRVSNRLMFWAAEQLGHIIVALDEESLVRYHDEALFMMYDKATFNRPRILFAWGRDNAELWRSFPGYGGAPIVASGNPRADMLRPEVRAFYADDVARIASRYGRFALFSSNFSFVNHYIPDFTRFRVTGDASAERSGEILTGIKAHKKTLFDAFLRLIPDLARAIAPANLVIRPHPSENGATWQAAAQGLGNVDVVHEGPIAPWLMAAGVLVQNGCTSAVEAALLGTPAVSFRPVRNDEFDPPLPFAVSTQATTPAETIAATTDALAGRAVVPPNAHEELAAHIASIDGALAVDRMLDAFDIYRDRLASAPAPSPLHRVLGQAVLAQRNLGRVVRARMKGKSNAAYTAHKFPGLDEEALVTRIAKFRSLDATLPAIRVAKLKESIFALERAG
jgi:surface carbohydrate biosynthesis protein